METYVYIRRICNKRGNCTYWVEINTEKQTYVASLVDKTEKKPKIKLLMVNNKRNR